MSVDPTTGDMWFADCQNCLIRVLRASTSAVTTIAGSTCSGSFGPLAGTTFGRIAGIAFDSPNGNLYVAQPDWSVIVRVSVAAGTVSVVAGQMNSSGWMDGPATSALLAQPNGLAMGPDGASVFWTEVRYCWGVYSWAGFIHWTWVGFIHRTEVS